MCDFNDRNFYASTVQKTYQISHSDPLHDQSILASLHKEIGGHQHGNFSALLFALVTVDWSDLYTSV
jgi:hypothetical protein